MPRSRVSEVLLTHRFHVLDVSFSIPPVLLPVWGFAACTSPEMAITYKEIKEGNYEYPRKVVERAEATPVTLESGSSLLNSDFWDWISATVVGKKSKKNLLIVHFTGMNPIGADSVRVTSTGKGVAGMIGQATSGLVEFNFRVPGKAWLLMNCSPAAYKAGSDFDALGAATSLSSLTIEYEEFTEFNMGV